MDYPPAKRQRSFTSRDSATHTPQTTAPGLRQSQVVSSLGALYSPTAYHNGGYPYGSYAASPVTTQHNGYGGGYPTSNTAYGTSPYSPQQQPSTYATQYTQNGAYGQPGLGGIQDGGYAAQAHSQAAAGAPYSPVHATHQAPSYHQPQPRNHSITIQHSQPSLSHYTDSYTSQTSAHTTPYHASPSPFTDPTVSQQYSPAPLPTPQNDTRQPSEEVATAPEIEEEDAQGEAAEDDSPEVYPKVEPIRPSIPSMPSMPTPSTEHSKPPENKCACKKGRGKKKACLSCLCSKYGLNCTSSCACQSACGNPFADLTTFFGPSSTFPKPCGANPCFATWLCNQPNQEELDTDLMVDMVLYDDGSWSELRDQNEAFKKWEDSWKKAKGGKGKKNREQRERLEFELLRGGLGNCNQNDFNGFWYSFCEMKWVPMDLWTHCQECRQCMSSAEWHCDKHNQCTKDRVCASCASTPYQQMA
ncbi:hypothetical protein F4780DRAFT_446546 [Xylariomycetidae sp. FL0641]|nr:hypothetical protein F4780DRAFT_446546 [Xylariomycetidae sp. FL0641]